MALSDKMINMDIISMLWYCTVREDISIYRFYHTNLYLNVILACDRELEHHHHEQNCFMRDDFCKLLNYLKILIALIVKADILCPLLSGYIVSFKRNFVYCLLGDIAL